MNLHPLAGVFLLAAMTLGAVELKPPARVGLMQSAQLAGRWQGILGEPGDSTMVIIDVDTLAGRWIAEATIPSQDVRDFPLGVEIVADSARFHLSRSGTGGPVLTVALPYRGPILNGVFSDRGVDLPVRLSRTGAPEISATLRSISIDSPNALDVTVLSADARELRDHFNDHAGKVRLVMLLSPT